MIYCKHQGGFTLKAHEYFKEGYSCSESMVMEGIDKGFCRPELLPVATTFSAGMSSGCVCGAIAGAQIVLGAMYGRSNAKENSQIAREKARELVSSFKDKYKFTCCKVLCKGLEGAEKKAHCTEMVKYCSDLLESMVKVKTNG